MTYPPEPWAWPAYVGTRWGLTLFVVALLPVLVVQYRRYGDLNVRRLVGACGLSVYLVALLAYTMLPAAPRTETWCLAHDVGDWQLVPFQSFVDAYRATDGWPVRARLVSRPVLQIVFNVLLFVPLGIWARRFFELSVAKATALGFVVSLAIETTQGTGNWGLWPCAYRFAQVDDLITNTFGAFLGAAGSWFFLFWMPTSSRLERARLRPRPVTVWRRWIGMAVDGALVLVTAVLASMSARALVLATGRLPKIDPNRFELYVTYLVPFVVVVVVPAMIGRGASIGQRIVWLVPRWRRPPTFWRRALRASVSPGAVVLLALVATVGPARVRPLASLVAWTIVALSVAAVLVTDGRRGLSGVLTGSDMVDARLDATRADDRATPDDVGAAQPRI